MKLKEEHNVLTIAFQGEMDHYQISLWKDQCMEALNHSQVSQVYFDFRDVTFLDSTGIGFVLGRYKQCHAKGMELILKNCSSSVHRLFEMSGLFQLMKEVHDE